MGCLVHKPWTIIIFTHQTNSVYEVCDPRVNAPQVMNLTQPTTYKGSPVTLLYLSSEFNEDWIYRVWVISSPKKVPQKAQVEKS